MAHHQPEDQRQLLTLLLDHAAAEQIYLIARLQRTESRSLSCVNGTTQQVSTTSTQGLGLHVFTTSGHSAFAATDRLTHEAALAALQSAIAGARAAAEAGLEANTAIFDVAPEKAQVLPALRYGIDAVPLAELQREVEQLCAEIQTFGEGLSVRVGFSIDRERWHIRRSDGTSVEYLLPHCYCSGLITSKREAATHTVHASMCGTGYELLLDPTLRQRLLRRMRRAALLAQALHAAPAYPAGSYDLVLDHALAKGLAHEAFGHAAEADGLRSSVLGDGSGRLRAGEVVAPPFVNLIDEPLEGDHAYQPFSPNGVRRGRATIIKDGVLHEALADVFSAAAAGTPIIDAARAQHYAAPPVPRMTNTRIEVREPLPLREVEQAEDLTAEDVRQALLDAGLLTEGRPVIFLSGYKGGQVNPAQGDFVFNCAAIYELTTAGVQLYQPAIFSGSSMAALRSIKAGIGPLQLDALGFCGKAGQSVPSSGGSHMLLFLEANERVLIGGR